MSRRLKMEWETFPRARRELREVGWEGRGAEPCAVPGSTQGGCLCPRGPYDGGSSGAAKSSLRVIQ